MNYIGIITISGRGVTVAHNPMDFGHQIAIRDEETLDSIIEQCRDIKLKLMEEKKNEQLSQLR